MPEAYSFIRQLPIVGPTVADVFGLMTPDFTPEQIARAQGVLRRDPVIMPDALGIINARHAGMLSESETKDALLDLGIPWHYDGDSSLYKRNSAIWGGVFDILRPRPAAPALIQANLSGALDKGVFDYLWRYSGAQAIDWQWAYDAMRMWLPPGALQELENRGLLKDREFYELLRRLGGPNCRVAGHYERLRHQLPPITDVIRFALREVFSPKLRDELKLLDEYPEMLNPAAQAVGYSTWQAASDIPDFQKFDISIPQAYWAAHWQPISPSQSYTMMHRIRSDNVEQHRANGFDVKPFTVEDVRRWLRVSDYPPGIRDYLAAISYRLVTRVDTRRLYDTGIWNRERVRQSYLDRGHNPQDAEDLTRWSEEQKDKVKRKPYIETFRRELLAAYRTGTLNRDAAFDRLASTEQEETDVERAAAKINMMLDTVDLGRATDLVDRAINAAKADYLDGAIDRDVARAVLARMNLTQTRIDEYLANWDLDRSHAQRAATTAKVGDWYVSGYLSKEQAAYRLTNLGWNEPDRALYLLEWDAAVSDKRMLASMQAARTESQKARAQQQALDRQRREARMARAEFARTSSPVWLRKWWRKKLVSEEEIWEWLRIQEWPDDRIQRFLSEIEEEQEANGTPS